MRKRKRVELSSHFDLKIMLTHVVNDMSPFLDVEFKREFSHRLVTSSWEHLLTFLSSSISYFDPFEKTACVRQLEALIKKNTSLDLGTDESREAAALSAFWQSERRCYRTNKRIKWWQRYPSRAPDVIWEITERARNIIAAMLGPLGPNQQSKIAELAGFGPGAVYGSTDRKEIHLYYKLSSSQYVTPQAKGYVMGFLKHNPRWIKILREHSVKLETCPGNRITFVPKTAKTYRTIAVEPSLNIYMQKGVDDFLKKRLKRFGLKLRDQQYSQSVAREASIDSTVGATIDLSQASDSISTELLRWLFPHDWFVLLDDLRSHQFKLKGQWHTYHKFSSMGNATTFPVESILFYAISKAVTEYTGEPKGNIRVYGDDIIVPLRAAPLLIKVLQLLGFETNIEKSFLFGRFKETCGADYYSGVDIRPVYLAKNPEHPTEVYSLFNRLLNNRCGIPLPFTLEYLYSLVEAKCYAPRYLPAGEEYQRWYAGSATEVDRGFHVPREVVKKYGSYRRNEQNIRYRVPSTRIRFPLDKTARDEEIRYACFLAGVAQGEVKNLSKPYVSRCWTSYYGWPDDKPWPDWFFTAI